MTTPAGRIGIEGAASKHWSVSGDLHWGGRFNIYDRGYLYHKSFLGLDANLNFYFKQVLQGVFLSTGGYYVVDNATAAENEEELPARLRSGYNAGVQLGVGLMQQITPKLNVSLRSSLRVGTTPNIFLGFGVGYNSLWKD